MTRQATPSSPNRSEPADGAASRGTGPDTGKRRRRTAVVGWCLAFAAAMTVYAVTMAPGIVWHDAGDYQVRVARLTLRQPGDAVRVHPLFIVLGHGLGRLGIWDFAEAASVTSALGTAIAVANVWLLVWLLVRHPGAATVGAAACMLAHTIWQQGVQPQTYGWSLAAMSAILVTAVAYVQTRRPGYLVLALLAGGVGLSAHLMSQLVLVVLGVWIVWDVGRRRTPAWVVPAGLAAWIVGGALFWYVACLEYAGTHDVAATLKSALVGRWAGAVFNLQGLGQLAWRSALMFVLNFPTPVVLLAAWGLWRSRRLWPETPAAALLLATFALYVLFAVRYRVPNQNFFFTPVYLLTAVYVGVGVGAARWARRRAGILVLLALLAAVVPTYWAMMRVARAWEFPLRAGRKMHEVPYRDVYRYYLLPWQHTQTGPRQFVEKVFERLPAGAALFADSTTAPPLVYAQEVEGRRPDLLLVAQGTVPAYLPTKEAVRYWWTERNLLGELAATGRRVFVVSDQAGYMPKWMEEHTRREPFGPIYEVLAEIADADSASGQRTHVGINLQSMAHASRTVGARSTATTRRFTRSATYARPRAHSTESGHPNASAGAGTGEPGPRLSMFPYVPNRVTSLPAASNTMTQNRKTSGTRSRPKPSTSNRVVSQ